MDTKKLVIEIARAMLVIMAATATVGCSTQRKIAKVPEAAVQEAAVPAWARPLLSTSWRTADEDEKTAWRMQFDAHRYVVVNEKGNVEDQGKLVIHPTERRIGLFNKDAGGWLVADAIEQDGLRLSGRMNFTMGGQVEEDNRYVKAKGSVFPVPKDIHEAATYGDVVAIARFLNEGVSIEGESDANASPLALAAYAHHTHAVDWLLRHGAKPNALTKNGKTALILAIESQDEESVKLLLDAGANVNHRRPNGDTPLLKAAYYRSFTIMKQLVERGANLYDVGEHGETVLKNAMSWLDMSKGLVFLERLAHTRFLVEQAHYNVNQVNDYGQSVLFDAVSLGLLETTKYLVTHGADPSLQDKNGKTAIEVGEERLNDIPLVADKTVVWLKNYLAGQKGKTK